MGHGRASATVYSDSGCSGNGDGLAKSLKEGCVTGLAGGSVRAREGGRAHSYGWDGWDGWTAVLFPIHRLSCRALTCTCSPSETSPNRRVIIPTDWTVASVTYT